MTIDEKGGKHVTSSIVLPRVWSAKTRIDKLFDCAGKWEIETVMLENHLR